MSTAETNFRNSLRNFQSTRAGPINLGSTPSATEHPNPFAATFSSLQSGASSVFSNVRNTVQGYVPLPGLGTQEAQEPSWLQLSTFERLVAFAFCFLLGLGCFCLHYPNLPWQIRRNLLTRQHPDAYQRRLIAWPRCPLQAYGLPRSPSILCRLSRIARADPIFLYGGKELHPHPPLQYNTNGGPALVLWFLHPWRCLYVALWERHGRQTGCVTIARLDEYGGATELLICHV
ncbi:hypothetical protein BC937DRAFT_91473 [Endogone sp. FLAS-F59071]|nr:hypothetical protein BC937DRAFT_91473 [Endogone sp. FLAS-F59071]|eukprot:RUS16227.1 hypothetical protein BC937DRAFT_91473 [Endogone sp. FLAS-F59071]